MARLRLRLFVQFLGKLRHSSTGDTQRVAEKHRRFGYCQSPRSRGASLNFRGRKRMPKEYHYELWNGKRVLGYYRTLFPLRGTSLTICETSILESSSNKKLRTFSVPFGLRVISDDGMDRTVRTVLDVRRKSKRQISILRKRNFY